MAAPNRVSTCMKYFFALKSQKIITNSSQSYCGQPHGFRDYSGSVGQSNSLVSTTMSSAKFSSAAISPPSVLPASPLILTPNSIKQMQAILDKNEFLRIAVDGGGCSGFQYSFSVDTEISPGDDCVVEEEGVRVVVDQASLDYLKGSTIDYSHELIRSSFRVQHNPQAEQGCSCGGSFAIKV